MAFKEFELPNIGTITVYKRRGSRSIRLTVDQNGRIKVTMPFWAPYASAVTFARSKQVWLQEQLSKTSSTPLQQNGPVGKQHRLIFKTDAVTAPRSRLLHDGTIIVVYPSKLAWDSPAVQVVAHKAAIRALRREAETILPERIRIMAERYDFHVASVTVRHLKSRWGSCDQDQNITLNLFLMQLPWELIDYVLLHELTHTKIMQHGPVFWQAMEAIQPDTKQHRKQIREYRTKLLSE